MNYLIIVAGGKGVRAKLGINKVFAKLGRTTILEQTLKAFEKNKSIDRVIISAANDDLKRVKAIVKAGGFKKVVDFVPAKESRQASVMAILESYSDKIKADDLVGIHNAVNPFVPQAEIDEAYKAAKQFGAALLAQPARDTVKVSDNSGLVEMTPLRQLSWYAQTPQVALFGSLIKAHRSARDDKFVGTDDAQLLERIGVRPKIVTSTDANFKITFGSDLVLAKHIIKTWTE